VIERGERLGEHRGRDAQRRVDAAAHDPRAWRREIDHLLMSDGEDLGEPRASRRRLSFRGSLTYDLVAHVVPVIAPKSSCLSPSR
jgi:hypothetical protein